MLNDDALDTITDFVMNFVEGEYNDGLYKARFKDGDLVIDVHGLDFDTASDYLMSTEFGTPKMPEDVIIEMLEEFDQQKNRFCLFALQKDKRGGIQFGIAY